MPEYVINIEKRESVDSAGVTQPAFAIMARHLMGEAYKTIMNQVIAPFMLATAVVTSEALKLYEILETARAKLTSVNMEEMDESENTEDPLSISKGFCLNIPEIGDLLISHGGDVVLNAEKVTGRSLKINAPNLVVLNNVISSDLEISSVAAVLKSADGEGESKVKMNSLKFTAIDSDLDNALVIDKNARLDVAELSLEEAVLMNGGTLNVAKSLDLNGGYVLNSGKLQADASDLKNISYFYNLNCG